MLAAEPFSLLANLDRVDDAIDANADIASEIVKTATSSFGNLNLASKDWLGSAEPKDIDKATSTIAQFYRDWSAEGAAERHVCYAPVIEAIQTKYARTGLKSAIKILVPGAGLGRLVFDLCRLGYTVEGNEISWHQLMASNWILNNIDPSIQYALYPFAHQFSNLAKREDQLKCVKIPDVHPGMPSADHKELGDKMSMTAGDFLTLYGGEGYKDEFDAVASVFFVDTAPNVIRYIETIRHCLIAGGIWINMGPLLWHFAERSPPDPNDKSEVKQSEGVKGIEAPGGFEMTAEELVLLVEKMGFEILMHEIREDEKGYIQNPESLLKHVYRCSHWIAKKKSEP